MKARTAFRVLITVALAVATSWLLWQWIKI